MIFHLIESGRHSLWSSGPTLWSAVAHAAIVGSLVVATRAPTGDVGEASPSEVVYFLPLLPERPERPQAQPLAYAGDEAGRGAAERGDGFTVVPVGGGDRAPRTGTEAAPAVESAPSDSGDATSSPIYLEAELDRPVERDPSSAGPIYPGELRARNVEGQVVAEWVVDTTGRADSASFRVVESTHPLFTRAVRDVLPAMSFRPAELMGERVRQLVRQQFRFVIERPARDTTPPRPLAPAAPAVPHA